MSEKRDDQPLTPEEVARRHPVAPAEPPPAAGAVRLSSFLVAGGPGGPPQVTCAVVPVEGAGAPTYRVDTVLKTHGLSVPVPHATVPGTRLGPELVRGRGVPKVVPAYRPPFLRQTYVPATRPVPPRRKLRAKGREVRPAYIANPDRRRVLTDTSYPWCTTGRVTTPSGSGAGVLVGPRHLLTASHVLDYVDDHTFAALQFAPLASGGSPPPFGVANAVQAYWYRQVKDFSDDNVAEDYAVVVLDQRMGDALGYMGCQLYTEDWNDQVRWWHVGYADDIGGGLVPVVQDQISFEDADAPGPIGFVVDIDNGAGLDLETESASIVPGASGGPFFDWWPDGYPYVVGVTSGFGTLEFDPDNWAGGGAPLLQAVHQALNDYP